MIAILRFNKDADLVKEYNKLNTRFYDLVLHYDDYVITASYTYVPKYDIINKKTGLLVGWEQAKEWLSKEFKHAKIDFYE